LSFFQEFFFLPFSSNDVAKGEEIHKGDNVEFYIATSKKTGSLKARNLRYINPKKQNNIVQGKDFFLQTMFKNYTVRYLHF